MVPPRELPAMAQIRKKGTSVLFGQARLDDEHARLPAGTAKTLQQVLAGAPTESVALPVRGQSQGEDH